MTTAGGGEHIAIVIAAEDRASRKIKQVGDSLRKNLGIVHQARRRCR